MKAKFRYALVAASLVAVLAPAAYAHRAWILPSFTLVSGEGQWVGVDAAISNELFYPDHRPMQLANLKAWAPDGKEIELKSPITSQYRSTFDLELTQPGTYRIAQVNGLSRTETFLTRDNATPVRATGVGLELVTIGNSHPNKLVATEGSRFAFHINGKPAAGLTVTVLPGESRYRDNPGELTYTTAADGSFTLKVPEPGYYWINTRWNDPSAPPPPPRTEPPAGAPRAGAAPGGPAGAPAGGGRGGAPSTTSGTYTGVLEAMQP